MNLNAEEVYPGENYTLDELQVPAWKRVLDIAVIILALPLLLPLALVIVILVRSVSAGPALYAQERVGYLGRRFRLFKFRTMYVDAETSSHQSHLKHLMQSDVPMEKLDSQGDRRIIPLGRLLRASGLDELPQILNVWRGEMSLVGPRPCLPYEFEQFLPSQKERFNTLPGLTGHWQVSGKNRTTFAEMMRLDIEYTRGKSFWWDVKIMFLTLPALLVQLTDKKKVRRQNLARASQVAADVFG